MRGITLRASQAKLGELAMQGRKRDMPMIVDDSSLLSDVFDSVL